MAKVIIVKYKGHGKYIAKAEEQRALTVHEMNSDIVPDCSLSVKEISAVVAKHYFNNVLKWNRENKYTLVQGQLPNNYDVFVQMELNENSACYSD